MINELMRRLDCTFNKEKQAGGFLDFLRAIRQGSPQMIGVDQQPALFYRFLGLNRITPAQAFPVVVGRFNATVAVSITGNEAQTLELANNAYWGYSNLSSRDRGLVPWAIALDGQPFTIDSAGRSWFFHYSGDPKILQDRQHDNLRACVSLDFTLSTRIDKVN